MSSGDHATGQHLRLYDELASWWQLMSAPEDYEEEARLYAEVLLTIADSPIETMLELGSGGGNNASHLKRSFKMTLVEPSEGMLEVSRGLNPELEHYKGDMRTVRLNRQFDSVFIHDAICYMTSKVDLSAALETAYIHLRPGGVVLFAPDHVRENFSPDTDHGGHDAPDGRGLRYLEWTWDPNPNDTTYTVDYAYLVRDADGSVRAEHDRHIEGLFSRDEWLDWIAEVGFEAARAVTINHSELDPGSYEVFVARRPAQPAAG
jgi:SAM-dependent methyltransferase